LMRMMSRDRERKSKKLLGAVALVLLVFVYVMLYGLLDDKPKSLVQISSLGIGATYLAVIVLIQHEKWNFWLIAAYVSCSVVSAAGFALVWGFDAVKCLIVGFVLIVLSLTSRVWLRAM